MYRFGFLGFAEVGWVLPADERIRAYRWRMGTG
jgi:hypothetical protein